ncbi:hypothetical protein J6590_027027 [Homalodisca vitripennis]|nr:hypothetical protein J6590_027027 [Homalodisca vitripennis]
MPENRIGCDSESLKINLLELEKPLAVTMRNSYDSFEARKITFVMSLIHQREWILQPKNFRLEWFDPARSRFLVNIPPTSIPTTRGRKGANIQYSIEKTLRVNNSKVVSSECVSGQITLGMLTKLSVSPSWQLPVCYLMARADSSGPGTPGNSKVISSECPNVKISLIMLTKVFVRWSWQLPVCYLMVRAGPRGSGALGFSKAPMSHNGSKSSPSQISQKAGSIKISLSRYLRRFSLSLELSGAERYDCDIVIYTSRTPQEPANLKAVCESDKPILLSYHGPTKKQYITLSTSPQTGFVGLRGQIDTH